MLMTTDDSGYGNRLAGESGLIINSRFSGETRRAYVGHVSAEAADVGPIYLVVDGDLIDIDAKSRTLNIVWSDVMPTTEE
ncbi:dihydroxy-acid dehydratase [Salmonella enterica]|uniref:dihydroxy-acid dehydratase domain-containing protein n=1 Tax=Salmonella enterica TaxID=28901 RepID=UPI00398C32EC